MEQLPEGIIAHRPEITLPEYKDPRIQPTESQLTTGLRFLNSVRSHGAIPGAERYMAFPEKELSNATKDQIQQLITLRLLSHDGAYISDTLQKVEGDFVKRVTEIRDALKEAITLEEFLPKIDPQSTYIEQAVVLQHAINVLKEHEKISVKAVFEQVNTQSIGGFLASRSEASNLSASFHFPQTQERRVQLSSLDSSAYTKIAILMTVLEAQGDKYLPEFVERIENPQRAVQRLAVYKVADGMHRLVDELRRHANEPIQSQKEEKSDDSLIQPEKQRSSKFEAQQEKIYKWLSLHMFQKIDPETVHVSTKSLRERHVSTNIQLDKAITDALDFYMYSQSGRIPLKGKNRQQMLQKAAYVLTGLKAHVALVHNRLQQTVLSTSASWMGREVVSDKYYMETFFQVFSRQLKKKWEAVQKDGLLPWDKRFMRIYAQVQYFDAVVDAAHEAFGGRMRARYPSLKPLLGLITTTACDDRFDEKLVNALLVNAIARATAWENQRLERRVKKGIFSAGVIAITAASVQAAARSQNGSEASQGKDVAPIVIEVVTPANIAATLSNRDTLAPIPVTQKTPESQPYVVTPGDTLFAIARQNNTTVDAIVAANGITNPDIIRVGQILTIPAPIVQPRHMLEVVAATPATPTILVKPSVLAIATPEISFIPRVPTSSYIWPGGIYLPYKRVFSPDIVPNIRVHRSVIEKVVTATDYQYFLSQHGYGDIDAVTVIEAQALVEDSSAANQIREQDGGTGLMQIQPSDCPLDALACSTWVTFPDRPTVSELLNIEKNVTWAINRLKDSILNGASLERALRIYHHNTARGDEYAQMVLGVYRWLKEG